MQSPIGVPLFWESGANPTIEWQTWFSTFKMAVMAKENMQVEQLLRNKPTLNDLFYPTIPSYEERKENSNEEEDRKREIRNERRNVDWENECTHIQNRGPMIDKFTWDEADLKIKSVIYLSLGTEATRIFHQRNPHTMIDRCTKNEIVYELGLTFTRPQNLTFDRFQLITVQQNANENLETFFRRLRELGSKCALGNVEEELIKDFFIAKMNNNSIQMELLSEVRTAAQVLNFALSRERGQENQREIIRSTATNWNTQVGAVTNNYPHQQPTRQQQTNTNKELCWRCGGNVSQGYITQCTAKQATCSICKKTGHFAKMCRSKIPPLPQRRTQSRGGYQRPQGSSQNQLRVRQIQESLIEEQQSDQAEEETIDPDSTLYIQELTEDWADVNHIIPKPCSPIKKLHCKQITTQRNLGRNKTCIQPDGEMASGYRFTRSFLTLDKSKELIISNPNLSLQPYNGQTQYRCFNNNNIKIEGNSPSNQDHGQLKTANS